MLFATSVHSSGGAEIIVATAAPAREMANAQAGSTLHTIDAKFALSEQISRGTDR